MRNPLIEGGIQWMAPLTIIFLIILALIVYVVIRARQTGFDFHFWTRLIMHVGGFALAVGVLGTIQGLFLAFGDLSRMQETLPFNVIMGGMRVAMITAIYGLIIFIVSAAGSVGLRLLERRD